MTIEKGKTYGLVGESGSGKSTIGKAIIGLEKIKDGIINYDKEKIDKKTKNQCFNCIGFAFICYVLFG